MSPHRRGSQSRMTSTAEAPTETLEVPQFVEEHDPISCLLDSQERLIEEILRSRGAGKVAFAAFMLKGEVEQWWKAIERLIKSRIEDVVITWELFLDVFDQKHFPAKRKEKMEEEFLNLRQGPMMVAEYEVKFNALACFLPHQVPNEAARGRRFKHGLNYAIRQSLEAVGLIPYADTVERAMALEG
ncbi:uncharacterized protein [Typha angustifolia]|uniref:uncharacterized protein n=1 Tax=Typha angustifolia TaxID=59011 RepID=UPI003C2C0D44